MLRGWLCQPHVAKWWRDADEEVAHIAQDLGSGPIDMRIVWADAPFAYLQDYDVADFPSPRYAGLPEGTRGMDTFLGDPAYLGLGHGSGYLRQRVRQLHDAGTPVVAVDPDPANAHAIAAYRKAGFEGDRIIPCEGGERALILTASASSG